MKSILCFEILCTAPFSLTSYVMNPIRTSFCLGFNRLYCVAEIYTFRWVEGSALLLPNYNSFLQTWFLHDLKILLNGWIIYVIIIPFQEVNRFPRKIVNRRCVLWGHCCCVRLLLFHTWNNRCIPIHIKVTITQFENVLNINKLRMTKIILFFPHLFIRRHVSVNLVNLAKNLMMFLDSKSFPTFWNIIIHYSSRLKEHFICKRPAFV